MVCIKGELLPSVSWSPNQGFTRVRGPRRTYVMRTLVGPLMEGTAQTDLGSRPHTSGSCFQESSKGCKTSAVPHRKQHRQGVRSSSAYGRFPYQQGLAERIGFCDSPVLCSRVRTQPKPFPEVPESSRELRSCFSTSCLRISSAPGSSSRKVRFPTMNGLGAGRLALHSFTKRIWSSS